MRGQSIQGEFGLIELLCRGGPRDAEGLARGVGDDCAVIDGPAGREWLVTVDALIEGVHFKREWSNFETLGRKALAVNFSDIAAMGGSPRFYLVSLGLPGRSDFAAAEGIYSGMKALAREFGAILIGGDTVASPSGICISITAIGDIESGKAIMRSGAKEGDEIYVSGELGGAALGLEYLMKGQSGGDRFVKKLLEPVPRVELGKVLADSNVVTSMIDISDGLLADLSHIADESGLDFEVDAEKVPLADGLVAAAREAGVDARRMALAGGEEYELLFTAKAGSEGALRRALERNKIDLPVTRIGMMRQKGFGRMQMESIGFDHFGG